MQAELEGMIFGLDGVWQRIKVYCPSRELGVSLGVSNDYRV